MKCPNCNHEFYGENLKDLSLPDGVLMYEVGGECVYPWYGISGAIQTKSICWAYIRGDESKVPSMFDGGCLPNEEGIVDLGDGWRIATFTPSHPVNWESLKERIMAAAYRMKSEEKFGGYYSNPLVNKALFSDAK